MKPNEKKIYNKLKVFAKSECFINISSLECRLILKLIDEPVRANIVKISNCHCMSMNEVRHCNNSCDHGNP
jgi:hypothetical protein